MAVHLRGPGWSLTDLDDVAAALGWDDDQVAAHIVGRDSVEGQDLSPETFARLAGAAARRNRRSGWQVGAGRNPITAYRVAPDEVTGQMTLDPDDQAVVTDAAQFQALRHLAAAGLFDSPLEYLRRQRDAQRAERDAS